MEIKNINIHTGNLIGAIASFIAAYMTAQGTLQEHIHFAGVANEIGFFIMASGLSLMLLISSFSKNSK